MWSLVLSTEGGVGLWKRPTWLSWAGLGHRIDTAGQIPAGWAAFRRPIRLSRRKLCQPRLYHSRHGGAQGNEPEARTRSCPHCSSRIPKERTSRPISPISGLFLPQPRFTAGHHALLTAGPKSPQPALSGFPGSDDSLRSFSRKHLRSARLKGPELAWSPLLVQF